MNFNEKYEIYKNDFEKSLYEYINNLSESDETLIEAMRYSIKAGGKRLRPVLMLATCDMLGVNLEKAYNYAIGLELIHTYSLIHDDLPDMDNDDFRRGKLTCHKVYGSAYAILAGDALLNNAFEICLKNCDSIEKINVCKLFAEYAGYKGMIGGQATDIRLSVNKNFTENDLYFIHKNKTSKLICAACMGASCLCGDKYINELKNYGYNLGMLFQITDDILDCVSTTDILGKTVKKDEKENKITFVSVYGINKSKEIAQTYYENAVKSIEGIENNLFLKELASAVYCRKN